MIEGTDAREKKKIKQIVVKKLFGTFDHTIPLNQEERTTIVVGPSGFGKTVILKLLKDLFSQSSKTLQRIPFGEFRVDFDDNTSLWVTKASERSQEPSQLTFHFRDQSEREQAYTLELPPHKYATERPFSLSRADYALSEPYDIDQIEQVLPTKEILSFENTLQRYREQPSAEGMEMPAWLVEVRQSVPVHLIGTQRLLTFLNMTNQNGSGIHIATVVPTANVYVEELTELLKTEQATSPELSQRIDKLKTSINKLFLHKELSVSREKGLVFIDSNGAYIAPDDLSLGEQHLLVLFYELLFKVAPDTLVLIDEPEISLHIVWQNDLLRILSGMGAISETDLLIVTHSPDFVHDSWDTIVLLEVA